MESMLLLTLNLIASIETNDGQNLNHKKITRTESIHYGDTAIGRYGMMPKTLKSLGMEDDPYRGAVRLATTILARNTTNIRGYLAPNSPCPFITAVILWERGP